MTTDEQRQAIIESERAADAVRRPVTRGQYLIRAEAEHLLALLDHLVPDNVAHYAVEDTRRALRELVRKSDTVHVHGSDELRAWQKRQ